MHHSLHMCMWGMVFLTCIIFKYFSTYHYYECSYICCQIQSIFKLLSEKSIRILFVFKSISELLLFFLGTTIGQLKFFIACRSVDYVWLIVYVSFVPQSEPLAQNPNIDFSWIMVICNHFNHSTSALFDHTSLIWTNNVPFFFF